LTIRAYHGSRLTDLSRRRLGVGGLLITSPSSPWSRANVRCGSRPRC